MIVRHLAGPVTAWARRRCRSRRFDQRGYVAILVAVFISGGAFLGCAALAVDTSRWTVDQAGLQQAADAAALAGVPYLPYDYANAVTRANQVAALNGYTNGSNGTVVKVTQLTRSSQLQVTISTPVTNVFGSTFGVNQTTVSQTAVADYESAAPMGSPCNIFGNEPSAGTNSSSPSPTGTARGSKPFSNCSSSPGFWASVEGPETGKVQGDRYQTVGCGSTGVDGCTGTSNDEYDDFGYTFIVKIQPGMVGKNVNLQLFDPEFLNTDQDCDLLPDTSSWSSSGNANPYTSNYDAQLRYSDNGSHNNGADTSDEYCTGDSFPGLNTTSPSPLTTSFILRQQVDSQNPQLAPVQNDTSGNACIRQYRGLTTAYSKNGFSQISAVNFQSSSQYYNDGVSQLVHNWVSMCTFTPQRSGDYYLQVRTNVSLGGTQTSNPYVYAGNTAAAAASGNTTTGQGANAFAVRAVTPSGSEQQVSVSGYNHMPIFINADSSTATFNLIQVLPGSAGQHISFSYFDAGDAQGSASVKVLPPTDATGSITTTPFPGGCQASGGTAGSGATYSDCNAPISKAANSSASLNNGKTETIVIPIPSDYTCNYSSLGGCWYRVQMTFGSGTVSDQTTWDAAVEGDPVRLVQ